MKRLAESGGAAEDAEAEEGRRENVERLLGRLAERAAEMLPAAASVVVFGSVVRGEDVDGSDLDVLIVRRDAAPPDDSWDMAVLDWSAAAAALSGRPVELIDAVASDLPELLEGSFWATLAEEGLVIAGRPLGGLGRAG